MVSFLFVSGILLAWVSSGLPDLSSTELDTGTGEMLLYLLVLESEFRLLQVKKVRMKKMMKKDSPVSKVSLRSMTIQKRT